MLRRLVFVGLALLLFLVGFVCSLPTLLSTKWGTNLLASSLGKSLEAKISIESLSLSFFGPQKIEGLHIEQKGLSFSASEILSTSTFLDLMRKHATVRVKEGKCIVSSETLAAPILFSNIELELETLSDSAIDFTLFCNAGEGRLSVQGNLAKTHALLPKMHLTTSIQALPVKGIEELLSHLLPKEKLPLTQLLGPLLSSDLYIESEGNSLTLKGKTLSENLSIAIDLATEQGTLVLKSPLRIDYTLPQQVLYNLSPVALHAEVTSLSYPLNTSSFDISALELQGELTTSTVPLALGTETLTLNPFKGEFSVKEGLLIKASSTGQNPTTLDADLFIPFHTSFFSQGSCLVKASFLPVEILLKALKQDPTLSSMIGTTLDLTCEYTKGKGTLSAKTPLLEISQIAFEGKNSLNLLQPASFHYTPNKEIDIQGTLSKLTIPSFSPLAPITAALEVQTSPIVLSSYKIAPTHLSITLSGLNTFDLSIQSPSLQLLDETGSIVLSDLLIPLHYEEKFTQIDLSAQTKQTGSFEALLGSTGKVSASLKKVGIKETLNFKMATPLLNATCLFDKEGQKLFFAKDQNQIQWTLTNAGYRALDHYLYPLKNENPPFSLKQPTTLLAKISQGTLLLDDLASSTFEGQLTDQNLEFVQDNASFSLSNMTAALKKEKTLTFDLNTDVTGGGSLRVHGELLDLEKKSGSFDGSLEQFPTSTCDLIARSFGFSKQPFKALFGEKVQAKAYAKIQERSGPIQLQVQSSNVKMALSGKLSQGTLLLEEPLHLQGSITPAISSLMLKEVNPLSITSFYSEAPVTLEIPKEGFALPLTPFELKNVSIPKGKFELGRIHCHSEGNVKTMLSLLKSDYSDSKEDLPLWFAPLEWSLSNGTLKIERTEILLADSLDVALWGNIDFIQNYVDMILGLTQQALAKAFGIQNLPKDYVMLVPMTGPLNDVEISKGGAATKIAMLLAWQKKVLSEGFGTGTKGRIIEGFLGAIAQLPDQNADVPPAKHPFPWEKENYKKRKASSKEEKKPKKFKSKENPFKQLMKVLK